MGAELQEATWEIPTRRDMALARLGLACAIVWTLLPSRGTARAEPSAKEPAPSSRKSTDPVRLPGHTRDDTGRVADPRALHGDSKIEGANATEVAGERVVRPIPSASTQANRGDATEPPPFQYVPSGPAGNPAPPSSTIWQAPAMPWTGTFEPAPSATPITPTRIDAGTAPDLKGEPPAAPSAPDLDEKAQLAAERSQVALTATEPDMRATKRKDRANKSRSAKLELASEEAPPVKPEEPVVPDMLDLIRAEIKGRLPYFQACADGSRRRAGLEIHRLQATWFINADGTIKEFRLDEVPDAQLAACLVRAGSRPFPIQPGMDLAIPTPIVFVR